MHFSEEEVRRVASLARVSLTPEEVGVFAQDLTSILRTIDQIVAATSDSSPLLEGTLPLREDRVRATEPSVLLESASRLVDGLFATKAVLPTDPSTSG